ncbi:hypothetical protein [Pseudomonas cremoricolorata]|uniref:Uncharacterized protein n=1 Tax=Pseudomonas cremoricolorata TaxID=157783 RepID=A0A089WU79_9PSED|nr:hypothetical protein [Pseudomonas cremoricolorata]AIR90764.1 hypothetical protein LK03_16480 [Pseudomonas cremoricolorata]
MAGFRVCRPDGSVAIDADYFNLALRAKGSLSLASGGEQSLWWGTLSVQGDQAIIAYRAEHPVAVNRGVRKEGRFEYLFQGIHSSGPIAVDWWLFDLPQYAQHFATAGKMLIRRPSDQQLVFDSRNKYLKVMDFVQEAAPEKAPRRTLYANLPAVIMVNRAWEIKANQVVQSTLSSMLWVNGGEVFSQHRVTSSRRAGPYDWQKYIYGGNACHMVIDVENY